MPFKKYFPVTDSQIFLNHAGMSAMTLPAKSEVIRVTELISQNGSVAGSELGVLLEGAREDLAVLVGTKANNISFIQNTTDGISMIASGLEIGEGDNIVVPMCEYPSNLYSWMLLKGKGVDVRIVGGIDTLPEIGEILSCVDAKTKAIAISYVQFHSGELAPLAGLVEETKKSRPLIVVDGVQAVGALKIDFDRSGIDCLISGAHKWLLGPPGTGFICMSSRSRELVEPTRIGWATIKDSDDLPDMSLTTHDDGRRYEGGTYNYAGIAGMAASARLLAQVGVDKVQDLVLSNAALTRELLEAEFRSKNIYFHPGGIAGKSGIVSFRIKERDSAEITHELSKSAIIVKERRGYVRISPHFYNTHDDLQSLVNAIKILS